MDRDTTVDGYAQMDACQKDNFELFAADGTGTVNEGADICPGKQQVADYTWALLNSDTRLAIVDDNPDTMDVVELTNTELIIKETKPNTSGTPVTYAWTLKNIK